MSLLPKGCKENNETKLGKRNTSDGRNNASINATCTTSATTWYYH